MVYRLQGQSSINRMINGIFLFNNTFRIALGQTNVLSSRWWTSQVLKLNTNIHVLVKLKVMVFYPMHPYVFMVYALDQIKFCCKIECSLPVLKLRIILNE